MRKHCKRLIKQTLLVLMSISQILFISGFSIAKARLESSPSNVATDANHQDLADIPKIFSLLEEKAGSREATQRLKDKAVSLSNKQTRMIASLAELISSGDRSVGAEVAFLVVAILIVVS